MKWICLVILLGLGIVELDAQAKDTIKPVKDEIIYLMDDLYKVWNGVQYKWGFHKERTVASEPLYDTLIYDYLHKKNFGYYRVRKGTKWGLLKDNKEEWVPMDYNGLNYNHRAVPSYISAQKGDKYGILDTLGKEVLEVVYDDIMSDGYTFKVQKGELFGIYGLDGKELIPVCFDKIAMHPKFDHTMVRKNKKWSVYNWIKGSPCVPSVAFDQLDNFTDYYVARNGTQYGLLDINAKEILKVEYQFLSPFFLRFLNTLLVGKDNKVGLYRIDEGKVVTEIPIEYDDIWVDEKNMKIKVKKGDKIDYYFNNETLFDLVYNDVQYYEHIDRVMVKKGNKWGMSKVSGELMIPIKYSKIHIINKNMFMIQKGGKWGIVNARGDVMLPVGYDEFDFRPEMNIVFIAKKGKWGIATLNGGVILPPKYDELVVLKNKQFLVQLDDLWGVVAPGGRVVVPIEYGRYEYKPGKDKNIIKLFHPNGTVKKYKLVGGF